MKLNLTKPLIVFDLETTGLDMIKDRIIQISYIKVMPDGTEKIVCCDYTKAKEVLVTLALDLAIQYQLLENLYSNQKEMHLVRELN